MRDREDPRWNRALERAVQEAEEKMAEEAGIQGEKEEGKQEEGNRRGETVKAVIVLKSGEALTEEEVLSYCKEKLGGVKAPKSLEFWDEIPKTPNGKTDKKAIRAQFWDDTGRAVH